MPCAENHHQFKPGDTKMVMNRSSFLALIFLSIIALNLSSCETVDGAGRDIENAGEAVQKSAN